MDTAQETQPAIVESRRPIILTIVCILGIVGAIANLWRVFFGGPSIFGQWLLVTLGVSAVVTIISMVGVWLMRRWAVYTYVVLCIAGQIAWQIIVGIVIWKAVLLRCLVIALLFVYFKRMR